MFENRKPPHLANYPRDGWELVNIEKLEARCKRELGCNDIKWLLPSFPAKKKRCDLRPNQRARLIFNTPGGFKKLWVEVRGGKEGCYIGKLSAPAGDCLQKVKEVVFMPEHVVEVG